ncbi:MAG: hypothetical protein ACRDOF_08405 [Gaiellaceae bacterium]
MYSWLISLVRGRTLEIALALALGYATMTLANSIAELGVGALAQHVGRDPFSKDEIADLLNLFSSPYYLNFSIGRTVIIYGPVLSAAVALSFVAFAGSWAVRRRDRELGVCPFCASRIPYESRHCAYCGSGVEPAES